MTARTTTLSLTLLLAACGGAEQPAEVAPDTEAQALTGAGDRSETTEAAPPRREGPLPQAEDFAVELRGPAATVPGHPPALPEYGDELRLLIRPDQGDSAGERVAVGLEVVARELFEALHAGDREAAGALLAQRRALGRARRRARGGAPCMHALGGRAYRSADEACR